MIARHRLAGHDRQSYAISCIDFCKDRSAARSLESAISELDAERCGMMRQAPQSICKCECIVFRERNIGSGPRCFRAVESKVGLFRIFRPKFAANRTVKVQQPLACAPREMIVGLRKLIGYMARFYCE